MWELVKGLERESPLCTIPWPREASPSLPTSGWYITPRGPEPPPFIKFLAAQAFSEGHHGPLGLPLFSVAMSNPGTDKINNGDENRRLWDGNRRGEFAETHRDRETGSNLLNESPPIPPTALPLYLSPTDALVGHGVRAASRRLRVSCHLRIRGRQLRHGFHGGGPYLARELDDHALGIVPDLSEALRYQFRALAARPHYGPALGNWAFRVSATELVHLDRRKPMRITRSRFRSTAIREDLSRRAPSNGGIK